MLYPKENIHQMESKTRSHINSFKAARRPGILFQGVFIALALILFPSIGHCQFRSGGYAELDDSPTTASLREHISLISSAAMEGRKAGSEGETLTAEYVYDVLKEYGVEMLSSRNGDQFGISRSPGDTVNSRNIVGVVQGYDHKLFDRYIVVAARMDNFGTHTLMVDGEPQEQIYYGANGNASGVAMMLELARMVATNSVLFRRSVIFIGLGASAETYAGAWYFLNRSFSDIGKIDAMINLDMIGTEGDMMAFASSNPDMTKIISTVSSGLHPVVPKVTTQEPYPSDHRAFYSKEIPSVMFTTGKYPEYATSKDTQAIIDYDNMERELEYLYSFTRHIANVEDAPAFSQDKVQKKEIGDKDYPYYECDEKPTFLGHADPKFFLTNWVYEYLKYPSAAVEKGIQGQVQVRFYIDKEGNVTDAAVTKSVDPLLDEEALKVINASPKWKAGKIKGVKVRSYMTVPIDFKLEKKSARRMGLKK